MQISQLALLSQLASEYPDIIKSAVSNFSPKHANELDNDDKFIGSNAHYDEDDSNDRLGEVENEIVMVIANISHKRRNSPNENSNCIQNKRRRMTYDRIKLYLTNPFTMERQECTSEYSICYANYVFDPYTENKKLSTLFRKRFRMPYISFLDITEQCQV